MTISRKLFLAALVATGSMAQAIDMAGFTTDLLKPWVAQSEQAVADVATRSFVSPKALYNAQKEALKTVKKAAKAAYKAARANNDATWFVKKQTYKAFKTAVYKNWKKTQLFPSL